MTELALRNNLLIALPQLVDTPFERTVTLLCEYNAEGALGLVINRPMEALDLAAMLDHLELEHPALVDDSPPVFWGGPVNSERGFVLHRDDSDWDSTMHLGTGLSLTSSRDILAAIGTGNGPRQFLVMLGYAGWDGGQLERELSENAWLSTDRDDAIVFDVAVHQRWEAANRRLGISSLTLDPQSGRA